MKLSVSYHKSAVTVQFVDRFNVVSLDGPLEDRPSDDFAVWLAFLPAAVRHMDIRVLGQVTDETVFNARVMSLYLGHHLSLPGVRVYSRPVRRTPGKKTIMPFSGGVDSCFTLFYGLHALNSKVDSGLVVHGLDMSLEEECEFDRMQNGCQAILDSAGARMHVLRTNYRKQFHTSIPWALQVAFVLAGLLQLYDGEHGRAFISGAGYGSHPPVGTCFDENLCNARLFHLFSSGAMSIDSFDAEFNRAQKIDYISQFDSVRKNLRVCWEGRRYSNCGLCRKCVGTQLAFLAATGDIPPCFPTRMTKESLDRLLLDSAQKGFASVLLRESLSHILEVADRRQNTHEFLEALKPYASCD